MLDGPTPTPLDASQSFEVLAVSLGLGALVGLQRQQAESRIAGIRTFPLITMLGTLSGLVGLANPTLGACLVVISMIGVIVASGLGNYIRARPWIVPTGADEQPRGGGEQGQAAAATKKEKSGAGITTEMA